MLSIKELAKQEIENRKAPAKGRDTSLESVLSTSEPIPPTGDPAMDFMLRAHKEVIGPIAQGANTAAFGLPKALMKAKYPEPVAKQVFPEQSTLPGKALRVGAELYGLSRGGAARTGMGINNAVVNKLGGGITARALGGFAGGAAMGGLQLNPSSNTLQEYAANQASQALGGGLFGLSVGVLAPTLKAVANMKNVKGARAVKDAQQIRGEFFKTKSEAIKKFGSQLKVLAKNKPGASVPLEDFADDFVANVNDMTPQARNAIKRTPQLKGILSGEKTSLTVKETQDAINYLNTKVPNKPGPIRNEILDSINDLRASQLDAFPEMAGVRDEYRKVIEPFNNVKNYFRFNKLLSAIKNDFGGPEGRQAVESLLSPETVKKMGGMQEAMKMSSALSELARNLTIGISSAIGAGMVFRNLYKKD